jgi:uncharacterized RDD family membrane protein YckC
MYCSNCGAKLQDNMRFCGGCGNSLSPPVPAVALTAEQAYSESIKGFSPRTPLVSARYSGFWMRTLAAIIDSVLLQAGVMILMLPLFLSWFAAVSDTYTIEELELMGQGMGFLMGLGIQWLYFTLLEASSWQATLGKKILGLRVTDMEGNRIGFGKANARYWGKLLSSIILLIGFFMVAFTEKKQGLHDKLANTLVVKNG